MRIYVSTIRHTCFIVLELTLGVGEETTRSSQQEALGLDRLSGFLRRNVAFSETLIISIRSFPGATPSESIVSEAMLLSFMDHNLQLFLGTLVGFPGLFLLTTRLLLPGYFPPHESKRRAWILSTVSSALMTGMSLPFVMDFLRACEFNLRATARRQGRMADSTRLLCDD